VGQIAGQLNKSTKYWEIKYRYKTYKAHRLAWLYVYGEEPKEDIDHIDGDTSNNRIENLREVAHSTNMKNKHKYVSNTSGTTGVYLQEIPRKNGKIYQRWVAFWCDDSGKVQRKYFTVAKYGFERAMQIAIDYRVQKIKELIALGAAYTERHGAVTVIIQPQ
jgi:hypothetical protein